MKKVLIAKDYFKDFKIDKGEEIGTNPYFEAATCKLCGQKITGLSLLGAISYCGEWKRGLDTLNYIITPQK